VNLLRSREEFMAKPKTFPAFTPKELEDTAVDLCYEVCTMIQARDVYAYGGRRATWRKEYANAYHTMANCALESFLLHYRLLKEFLGDSDKRSQDDIRATDYSPSWKTTGAWMSDKAENRRLHKRLAHITTARGSLNGLWQPDQMEQQILNAFDDFIQSLKPPTRQWFAVVEEAIAKKRARNALDTFSGSTVSVTAATILFPTDLF
jgi:hypothetical protein